MQTLKLCLSLMAALFMADCQKSQKDEAVVVVGICSDYPPFESRNHQNELVGYDVDLAHLIGEGLGKRIEFVDMPFNTLLNSVRTGKIDAVISSVAITEERRKQVDFSDPYFFNRLTIVSRKAEPLQNENALKGKKIGAQMGTTFVEWAKERGINNIVAMDFNPQLIEAVKAKQIDGVIIDYSQAAMFCKQNPGLVYHFLKREDNGSGIVMQKNSPLREKINAILKGLKESGKLVELEKRWL